MPRCSTGGTASIWISAKARPSLRRSGAASGMRALLESPVREAAIVYINGQRAGSVWHPPYEIDITGLLHAGENTLRIVVANLATQCARRAAAAGLSRANRQVRRPLSGSGHEKRPAAARGNSGAGTDCGEV